MILIWRGWGLLALVMLFPLLASCAVLLLVRSMKSPCDPPAPVQGDDLDDRPESSDPRHRREA